MDPWERFGLDPEEYEKCRQAAEELQGLSPDAPSVEELARDWGLAKAAQLRAAVSVLWRALDFDPAPLVRRLVPTQRDEGRASRG